MLGSLRNTSLISVFLFLIVWLCAIQVRAQQASANSSVSFSIDDGGSITADISLIPPQSGKTQPDQRAIDSDGLLFLELPLALDPTSKINAPGNVRIAPIDTGRGFTILAVIFQAGTAQIDFKIDGISHIGETAEGRAKFELDFSYPGMSRSERQLLTSSLSISAFDTRILLPRKYDETEVNFDRSAFSTTDWQVFAMDAGKARQPNTRRYWIVFPSPVQRNFNRAVVLLTLLISSFGLFFHAEKFRERRIRWSIGVLVSSLIILGLTAFFAYTLAKRLEFLAVASAAIPQVLYGFLSSLYLLLGARYQVRIVGQVTVDGRMSELVQVTLYKKNHRGAVTAQTQRSIKDGKYAFYLWRRAQNDRYQIKAGGVYTTEGTSPEFTAKRGEESEAPPIDLRSRVVATVPSAERRESTVTEPNAEVK